jgi:hypothetical protein
MALVPKGVQEKEDIQLLEVAYPQLQTQRESVCEEPPIKKV